MYFFFVCRNKANKIVGEVPKTNILKMLFVKKKKYARFVYIG